jgi:hypothetical protein
VSIADVIFLAVLWRVLALGQSALLNDPGTPWHIQLGRDTWRTGHVPTTDAYSFTRRGAAWTSQYWLADLLLAATYSAGGWNGVVAASALWVAWTYRALYRAVLASGANVAWAAGLTLLALACAAGHLLARPHVLSLLFLLLVARLCDRYHRGGARQIAWVPVLLALWANLHGAFLGGWIAVATSAVGHMLTPPRDAVWRRRAIGFAAVTVAAAAATLLNPYGWGLHRHLWGLLVTSDVRGLIEEWQSPNFHDADVVPFELLLAIAALLVVFSRPVDVFGLCHLGVWTHFALGAVRQVSLMAVVAAPILGRASAGFWAGLQAALGLAGTNRWAEPVGTRLRQWAELERHQRRPVWPAAASLAAVVAVATGARIEWLGLGNAGCDPSRWPVHAAEVLDRFDPTAAIFNDLSWGGYLILQSDGRRAVFVDDRFELYGREFVTQYLRAIEGGDAWPALDAQYRFRLALVRPTSGLARRLQKEGWIAIHADRTAVLLQRPSEARASANAAT